MPPIQLPLDKRWFARKEQFRKPPVVFEPRGYAADVIAKNEARDFVTEHHYSGSFPPEQLSFGLFGPGPELVGVAVFGPPASQLILPKRAGVAPRNGTCLSRFVLLPEVAFNGESWFLGQIWSQLPQDYHAVVSYADPMERRTAAGELTKPAHWGTIYQATNAAFLGRTDARWKYFTHHGLEVSERALTKIRTEDQGEAYAAGQLLRAGAPPRMPFESPADWVMRVLQSGTFTRVRHPGNLVYVFGLNTEVKKTLQKKYGDQKYPKPIQRGE
jgi:hypothetical protein